MRGAILPGGERVELKEFDRPEPGHGQVLVKMKASGLCGSDLRAIYHEHTGSGAERYQNVIAGHEPSGQIEAVGPGVGGFEPGDRVVVYHIVGCGRCEECTEGFMIGCTSRERSAYGWQRDGATPTTCWPNPVPCSTCPTGSPTRTAPSWPADSVPPTRDTARGRLWPRHGPRRRPRTRRSRSRHAGRRERVRGNRRRPDPRASRAGRKRRRRARPDGRG